MSEPTSQDTRAQRTSTLLRILAAVYLLAGLALAGPGAYLIALGGSPWYAFAGLVLAVAGVRLWQGRSSAASLCGLLALVTLAWALWEAGWNGWALAPRVSLPLLAAALLWLPPVRARLEPHSPGAFAGGVSWLWTAVALVAAIGLGAALRAVAPPTLPEDPVYQAGRTAAPTTAAAPPAGAHGDWPHYGNDAGGLRFSPLEEITPANVARLEPVWTARVGESPAGMEATPVMVDDALYLCTGTNDVIALHAETGELLWRFDHEPEHPIIHPICRGVSYYRAPGRTGACAERILSATVDARLIALDARDGQRCADFGENGEVALVRGLGAVKPGYYLVTSAPTVVRDKVVVGGFVADNQYWGEPSGVIRAFDAVTGELDWAWDMGRPDRRGEPPEGETYTPSTPNSWAPMSADEELGLVYVPLGNPTPDFFGAHRRSFDEEHGSAVVALDADTGRLRWSFQTVHHDVWDYDVPAQPSLVDFRKDGRPVRALLMPTKQGELFVLDRTSGEPVYPVEERPTPQAGAVPDERLSATQPFSVGVPAFRGADLTEASMWGVTPFDQLWCRIRFRQARYEGLFTPPGLTPSVQYPGYIGGMEWGSVAVDIARQIVVVPSNHVPNYQQLIPRQEADAQGLRRFQGTDVEFVNLAYHAPQEGTPYAARIGPFLSPLLVPCNQPPFGRLSAVDLGSGKLLWTRPLGSARDGGPLGMRWGLPFEMGTPLFGGAIATQSGLTFISAAQDSVLRAYDTASGELLWSGDLPAGGNATPISYTAPESGRQFVVIVAAGNPGAGSRPGDHVVAFALPSIEGD